MLIQYAYLAHEFHAGTLFMHFPHTFAVHLCPRTPGIHTADTTKQYKGEKEGIWKMETQISRDI